jgi:hypothetical protein
MNQVGLDIFILRLLELIVISYSTSCHNCRLDQLGSLASDKQTLAFQITANPSRDGMGLLGEFIIGASGQLAQKWSANKESSFYTLPIYC